MANAILWQAEPSAESAMTTELNSLASEGIAVAAAAIDNGSAGSEKTHAAFELFIDDFGGVPVAGAYVELHVFYALDGTNYADGFDGDADADSLPTANTCVGEFAISASDADQRVQLVDVPIAPFAFKTCLKNKTGQALGATGNTLKVFRYNHELQ